MNVVVDNVVLKRLCNNIFFLLYPYILYIPMHFMQHSNEKDFLNPKLQSGADLLTIFHLLTILLCSKWSIKGFNQKHSRTIPRSRDGKNHLGQGLWISEKEGSKF
ncbi:MAG: hypothetical protein NQ127_01015 [Candidatus Cardinium sp.]|nr:hypothetical protein [Candidatus Cardinium sp.]